MAVRMTEDTLLTVLQNSATQLRIDSVRATSEAGSGHPSSCALRRPISWQHCFSPSCATDPKHPKHPANDRFILSKGHAAPSSTPHGPKSAYSIGTTCFVSRFGL